MRTQRSGFRVQGLGLMARSLNEFMARSLADRGMSATTLNSLNEARDCNGSEGAGALIIRMGFWGILQYDYNTGP